MEANDRSGVRDRPVMREGNLRPPSSRSKSLSTALHGEPRCCRLWVFGSGIAVEATIDPRYDLPPKAGKCKRTAPGTATTIESPAISANETWRLDTLNGQ
jgi:hypothetical protein